MITKNIGEYGGWDLTIGKFRIGKRSYGFDYYWNNKCYLTSAPRYMIINGNVIAYVFGGIRGIRSNGESWFKIPIFRRSDGNRSR